MSVSTAQGIIAVRAPGFATAPDLADLVTLATQLTGAEYGVNREYAKALLVMHWLSLRGRDGGSGTNVSAGSIQSESEGSLSRSYGVASGANVRDAGLGQTAYGLELLSLRDSVLITFRNRMM